MRRQVAGGFWLALAAMTLMPELPAARAQDYPSRPIRIIVPTPPGGMSDLVSRVYGQKLTERSKHAVVVENKTGSNGVLAAETRRWGEVVRKAGITMQAQ